MGGCSPSPVFSSKQSMQTHWYRLEYGCDVTAMVANTGTAMGDSNGYEVTLSAIEAEAPYKLQSSVVTSLGI